MNSFNTQQTIFLTVMNTKVGIKKYNMSIPKIIYYIWLGDRPLPEQFNKYIDGWKNIMPDYEIRFIDNSNYPHSAFVDWCIEHKDFAAASNYIRCQILYETGGLYFDIDIEVVKKFDDLLNNSCFVGREDYAFVNCAVIGSEPNHPFLKRCLDYMDNLDMNTQPLGLTTGPRMVTRVKNDDITIYPVEYFYPYHYTESFYKECVKENTYAIHHWAKTW